MADVVYDKVGNIFLSRIMGADVRLDPAGFDIGIRKSWEDALASGEDSGGHVRPSGRRRSGCARGLHATRSYPRPGCTYMRIAGPCLRPTFPPCTLRR